MPLFSQSPALVFPNQSGGVDQIAYFGPNFRFEQTPEPATLWMTGMAAVALGLWRLRARRPDTFRSG